MRVSYLLTLGFFLVAPVAFVACSGGEASNTPQPQRSGRGAAQAAVPVTVATVERKSMPIEIRVIGTAEPYSTVAVRAQLTGQLTDVKFKEGDDVRVGQPLFALDRRPLESALAQAQANLDRDLAQAANAESQARRYQDLAERGIATREQVDTSRTGATASTARRSRTPRSSSSTQRSPRRCPAAPAR
jgi:multidrug efflux system membrane fusion protein